MLPMLLDPENTDTYDWADPAYAGACFEDLLNLGGLETCIHEKGSRNHPLTAQSSSVIVLNQRSELVLNIFLAL